MEEGQGFMALEEYVRKRKFEKTPEPPPQTQAGRTAAGAAPRFYVQRHDATRLHPPPPAFGVSREGRGCPLFWGRPTVPRRATPSPKRRERKGRPPPEKS